MTVPTLTVLAAGLLLAPAAGEGKKADRDPLRGAWAAVSMEQDGKKVIPEGMKLTLTFKDGAYTYPSAGGFTRSQEGTYKLHPAGDPKALDIIPTDGPYKGKAFPGIYELRGDTLKACFDRAGKGRPTEFSAGPGSGRVVVIYKRQAKE
jgi:uncharacterized protein (TIGR03067 family)